MAVKRHTPEEPTFPAEGITGVRRSSRLLEVGTRDPLTRALLHHYFCEQLESRASEAWTKSASIAVMVLDLDFFKVINDTAGHEAGDRVLQEVVVALSRCVGADLVTRYGEDEFALVAHVSSVDEAVTFAERIRAHIQAQRIHFAELTLGITVSIGVAVLNGQTTERTADALLAAAEARLRRAKLEGRNRVCAD